MDDEEVHVATEVFDELIALNVLLEAADQNLVIENNFPLFLVGQPGKYRCIADGKTGDRIMFASMIHAT